MKVKSLAFACSVLLLAHSPLAQTVTTPADPVSGTWSGHMARDGDRMSITVTLKFDGTSMTGMVEGPPSPGIIRSGTFDKGTGALKFQVEVQDAAKTIATFDGKVVNDTASGSVTLNGGTGTFSLTRGAAGAASSQQPPPGASGAGAALQNSFATVSGYVTKSAELIPADKYSYRPTASVRSVGQLIAHIADGYSYYCAAASGRKVEWSDAVEKGNTDKAVVLGKLKEASAACDAAYGGTGHAPLIENLGHTNLHYGNLITYMRMLGLVPPSS